MIAVWVGFDDGESVRVTGSVAALPIFADVLEVARGKAPAAEFDVPTGVESVEIDADSGLRAGFLCGGTREVFLRGTRPRGHLRDLPRPRHRGRAAAATPNAPADTQRQARKNPVTPRARARVFGWFGRGPVTIW